MRMRRQKTTQQHSKSGHIVDCWKEWHQIPILCCPLFCPAACLTDVSVLFSEQALVMILWQAGSTICMLLENAGISCKAADNWVTKDGGQLLQVLFIGNKGNIWHHKWKGQTSYGKHATVISDLSSWHPYTHGPDVLGLYLDGWFEYCRKCKITSEQGQDPPQPPWLPPSPPPQQQYALLNMVISNGKKLGILVFNTRRWWGDRTWIPDITKRFPNHESVTQQYGDGTVDVAGVDPGEHVTASFTALYPNRPSEV